MEINDKTRETGVKKMNESVQTAVPIWEKANLTLEEAAQYFNIGINKLRELSDKKDCSFVLFCGSKRLIKRKALEAYFDKTYSI